MNLRDLLNAKKELSAAPQVACKLSHLIDTSPFLEEIITVVQYDPSLTARILQVCNTVVFRGRDGITSLEEAVSRLGLQTIMIWTWQLSLGDIMRSSLPVYRMNSGTFWRHSVMTAVAAEELLKLTSKVEEDKATAFTAGLLHDIGKILINSALLAKPRALYDYSLQERLSLQDAERQLCGFDHAQVGGELLKLWNLPSCLVLALLHHHHPNLSSGNNLACLLHLADICSHTIGESYGSRAALIPVHSQAFDCLNIEPRAIEHLMINIHLRVEDIENFISICA